MTRIGYSDDEEYPGQFDLWRANVGRSLQGKRGQQALRDLEAALLALPEKRLIAGNLTKDGMVCTVGALVVARREQAGAPREIVLADLGEEMAPSCACWHAKHPYHDNGTCSRCAEKAREWDAAEAAGTLPPWSAKHRPTVCGQYRPGEYGDDEDDQGLVEEFAEKVGVPRMVAWRLVELNEIDAPYDETDEQRYERVLGWVRRNIGRVELPV